MIGPLGCAKVKRFSLRYYYSPLTQCDATGQRPLQPHTRACCKPPSRCRPLLSKDTVGGNSALHSLFPGPFVFCCTLIHPTRRPGEARDPDGEQSPPAPPPLFVALLSWTINIPSLKGPLLGAKRPLLVSLFHGLEPCRLQFTDKGPSCSTSTEDSFQPATSRRDTTPTHAPLHDSRSLGKRR